MKTTCFQFISENRDLLNITGIAKVAGIPRMTFQDILLDQDRWEKEDYRVEIIMRELRDNLNTTFKKKYGGK